MAEIGCSFSGAGASLAGVVLLWVGNSSHDGQLRQGFRIELARWERASSLPLAQTENPLEAAGIDLILITLHHGRHVLER